jgi:phosphopantothenoylcysteine decarboxylase/phosphopantothenate--cysteine ligase
MNPINNKLILLGVTGSIAAYKATDLASKLTQLGAHVHTILTDSATKFISPLSFQSVTGVRAYTDKDLWGTEAHVLHVGLAHQADSFVVAPATASSIAKIALGLADNLLSVTALACGTEHNRIPILIAPAMDAGMFNHEATQTNLKTLIQRGYIIIGPEEGHLASGLIAKGRMSEPYEILGQVRYQLSRGGPLKGKKIIVTAGGTQEDIDPVRYISNRSSGKQGYAIAQSALDAGSEVVLITAPTNLNAPVGIQKILVRSAEEMMTATFRACEDADVLIMAAAVADYQPITVKINKIKKNTQGISISLKPTIDILKEIATLRSKTGYPILTIGFAAETEKLIENAETKMQSKKLDLLVANDVSRRDSGFSVDTNRVTFLFPDGRKESQPLMRKSKVADKLIEELIKMIAKTDPCSEETP